MLKKKLLICLVLGVVVALPGSTQAAVNWTGATSSVWDYAAVPSNWTGNPIGVSNTEYARIDISGAVITGCSWPQVQF